MERVLCFPVNHPGIFGEGKGDGEIISPHFPRSPELFVVRVFPDPDQVLNKGSKKVMGEGFSEPLKDLPALPRSCLMPRLSHSSPCQAGNRIHSFHPSRIAKSPSDPPGAASLLCPSSFLERWENIPAPEAAVEVFKPSQTSPRGWAEPSASGTGGKVKDPSGNSRDSGESPGFSGGFTHCREPREDF